MKSIFLSNFSSIDTKTYLIVPGDILSIWEDFGFPGNIVDDPIPRVMRSLDEKY